MWYKNYFIIELNIILFSWLAQCTPKKKWRGKTKGVGLSKQRSAGEKLRIEIPSHLMRVVGNNAQTLITELGIIVRQMASLNKFVCQLEIFYIYLMLDFVYMYLIL